MKPAALNRVVLVAATLACVTGCMTRAAARKQTEAAYQAGQRQALIELYERKFGVVTVLGPVRNPKLDWTEDLTLARAIVEAGYHGRTGPREIIVRRGEEETRVDPRQLLAGEDWTLQAGDRIEILP